MYSHLDTAQGRRLVFTDASSLRPEDLSDRWQLDYATWGKPRPIVFLMACHSAAIDDSLLGGFAEIFHTAGALASVGTEAPAFSPLVTEFASRVGGAWWSGSVTLGEAVLRYRVDLMNRGNLLGFVFTALGNSDLKLSRGRQLVRPHSTTVTVQPPNSSFRKRNSR